MLKNKNTQVTLLTNVMCFLRNKVAVTSLILNTFITTSNEITNLSLSNA